VTVTLAYPGLLVQATWTMTFSTKGGALRTRYKYYTLCREASKKKTIVSIARKLAELMYSVLRNKTDYEPRKWDGPKGKSVDLAGQAMCA